MRPIRSAFESLTSEVPEGPLGFIGGGNATGATVFFTVGVINRFNPVTGFSVGYSVESHSVEREDEREIHTFQINSALEDTARFVAKKNTAPSNIDFAIRETKIQSVEPVVERSTFNTWRIVTVLEDRPMGKEAIEDEDE